MSPSVPDAVPAAAGRSLLGEGEHDDMKFEYVWTIQWHNFHAIFVTNRIAFQIMNIFQEI